MSKASKLYKVFMTAMIVAIAGMLLASGLIALQKSMKLNLSFNMNPNIFCRIDASIGDNTSYNTIFCNTPDNATIGAGWSGNGNTLTFTNSSADMVKTVYLKIWNHTETRVMIETTNHTSVISAGTLATGTQGSEFSVSVPANGKANLDFSQVFAVDVSGVSHATVTPESNVYTIGGTYYVKSGATPTFAIESSEHYDELDDVTVSSTAEKSFLNGVLTLSNITGDVIVTASASAMSYTITYYKNAGDTTTVHTTQSVTYDDPYSIPTEPTRADYIFLGWATSSDATSATWEAGSTSTQTCSGNKDWYAVWQANNVTITFTTSSNLQVNSINGTTATPLTSLDMKTTETKNVVVTSTTTGQWSRAVTCSVTGGSADVSLDKFTGDLTITTPTGDTTINISENVGAFKPWTYGTYVNNEGSAIGDKVSYNTVHYPAFEGYKYIQFQNKSEITTTNHDGTTQTVPLRWIAIGAGANVNTIFTETNANVPTGDGVDLGKDLGDDQVLVLSEKLLLKDSFDDNNNNGSKDDGVDLGDWNDSTLKAWLNGDTGVTGASSYNNRTYFLDATGWSTYVANNYIATTTTKTADNSVRSNTSLENDNGCSIFLLAHYYTNSKYPVYGLQNYMIQTYLGAAGTSKYIGYLGTTATYWWLRSGDSDSYSRAYFVDYGGYVNFGPVNSRNIAVRSSFILNLA